MSNFSYLKNFINLKIKKIQFDWKTKTELAALKANLHKSNLEKFNKYTNKSELARAELFSAKEKFIESKVKSFPAPWSKDFQVTLNYYYADNVPQIVINRFSYLYHKYHLNSYDGFYYIAEKILESSYGDLSETLILIDAAAKDYRDILS